MIHRLFVEIPEIEVLSRLTDIAISHQVYSEFYRREQTSR
jgi:hypothetical protein